MRGLKCNEASPEYQRRMSHPTGVRGLKWLTRNLGESIVSSHPTGVRGLKCLPAVEKEDSRTVAPHWGAWIEIVINVGYSVFLPSHPTGVRGLKYRVRLLGHLIDNVAPHWGAWIEIANGANAVSHFFGRTPLGCVD